MSDKIIKFLVVVCLTLLIWTWAFLSQEDEEPFSAVLEVSPATDRSLWVTFWSGGNELGQRINLELEFKGTPAKIAELSRQTELASPENPQRNPLNYYYNPRDFGHTQTQFYQFDLLEFLQRNSHTKGLALTLESCSINQNTVSRIEVQIEVLEKKQLTVECVDESGLPVKGVIAQPAQVEMYVRDTYIQPAYVTLSARQIELAQQRPIRVRPYVEMGTDERRRAQQEVTITILKESVPLQPRAFQPLEPPRRIGYICSENLMGKYTVQMDEESVNKLRTINLRATNEAWEAYSRLRYPILIEIRDEDVQNLPGEIPPKEIIYNFPREFVAKQEIELGDPQPPKTAKIHLTPAAAPTESP